MPLDLTEEDEQKWLENSEKWKEFVADLLLLELTREAETPFKEVNFFRFELSASAATSFIPQPIRSG